MRILHVLPALANGGAERLVVGLANRAAQDGHHVTLLTVHRSPHEDFARDLHAGVTRWTIIGRVLPILGRRATLARAALAAWIPFWTRLHGRELLDFDVVHVHLRLGAWVGSWVHRARGPRERPVIVESFHADWDCVPASHRRFFEREWTRRDALILESPKAPTLAELAETHPRLPARFIAVGVDRPPVETVTTDERDAWLRRAGIPSDRSLLVVVVSRMHGERKSQDVVPAFAEVVRRLGPGVHLAWIGDGPQRGLIESQVRESGLLRQVHLLGFDSDVRIPLSTADLALMGHSGDECGIAGLEAILAGVPVIGLQWLPDWPEGGWIPSTTDPVRVGEIAAELATDPAKSKALAAAQHERATSRHSMDATWSKTLKLYEELAERPR